MLNSFLGMLDMTENKLRNMIENHGLDNLINSSEEIERLKKTETTEQVLEILKKYNYEESAEVFKKELLEILHSIELNEDDMKRVSGGNTKNTKYLSAVLGGLVAINGVGVLPAKAFTKKEEKNTSRSFLNKVDKSDAKKIGGGATLGVLGTALVWAIKEFVTKKNKQHADKEFATKKNNQHADKEFATKKNNQHAELYELLLPDLVEHLPARAIPYLKAVYQYLSYRNEYLQKNPGDVVIKDLSDKKFIALAENVLVEVALLAGNDLGLQITPTMVRKAIEKNGTVETAEYSLIFSSNWKNEPPKSLLAGTLLGDIYVTVTDHSLPQPMSSIYYPERYLRNTPTDYCNGEYQRSLLKALKLIEKNFLPDGNTSDILNLDFTPDYGQDDNMFNYEQIDVNSDSDESEL